MIDPDPPSAAPTGHRDDLVRVEELSVHYLGRARGLLHRRRQVIRAVDGISFQIKRGETLGLVGETGSGKSTTGRALLLLEPPTSGTVHFEGVDLTAVSAKKLRKTRPRMQMIFQDPYSSLNPRMRVAQIVAEPLHVHRKLSRQQVNAEVRQLLDMVGLARSASTRYPREFSGGQQQRIGIARALALRPSFVVCDEPISALDVSIRAQIISLLQDLQREMHLTYLFIAHDLSVVHHVSDRVAVMYLGKLVEVAPRDALYQSPLHPYSKALLSAIPIPDPRRERSRRRLVLQGDIPSAADPPTGCRFRTRCPFAQQLCADVEPPLEDVGAGHSVACHFWESLK